MALRCEGQTLKKKKKYKLSVKLSVAFVSEQSVGMTLARRYDWSGTPLKAGQSPAAAHFAELRSFRRGWWAWLVMQETV